MDSVSYNGTKNKRYEQMKTLQDLQPGVRVGRKKTLHIDPAILFSRCSAIAQRIGESLEPYCKWEMCVIPPSLFKDNFTRKPVKSELADTLYRDVHVADMGPSGEQMSIVDGGWLLHYISELQHLPGSFGTVPVISQTSIQPVYCCIRWIS